MQTDAQVASKIRMITLFCGFDPREEVGYHAFCASVLAYASEPVAFIPLHKAMLEGYLDSHFESGTNEFTKTRFLIPALMGHKGWAIFADAADMVCISDIADLMKQADIYKAVQVVKHDYRTKAPIKYLGTDMQAENVDYPRKNWASLMLVNCNHFAWPSAEAVAKAKLLDLLQFKFMADDLIGELPKEWNWLADEYGPNDEAKVLHWTQEIPGFEHYRNAPMANVWKAAHAKANYATP